MSITATYARHLKRKKLQENSISSYLSDVQLFLNWSETNAPLMPISLKMVDQYLRTASFTRSKETMKRKQVSLTHFVEWMQTTANPTGDTITSSKAFQKYRKLSVSALALLLVSIQIVSASPTSNIENIEVESIDNPFANSKEVSTANDNFTNVNQDIPIAVSGYEISPALEQPSSSMNVVLSLHDDAASSSEDEGQVMLSPLGGTETIERGNNYTIIVSHTIREHSIITFTPTGPTNGQALYI
jgi:hypothetical protein